MMRAHLIARAYAVLALREIAKEREAWQRALFRTRQIATLEDLDRLHGRNSP